MARYVFETIWQINAPFKKAVDAIFDSRRWVEWWDGLESATVLSKDKAVVGTQVDCIWRSSAGYRLKLQITITSYEPYSHLKFTSTGDLVGQGAWHFVEAGDGTHMHILWDVHTTKRWMNMVRPVLKPVFAQNHHRLMRQGETGLNNYLAEQT